MRILVAMSTVLIWTSSVSFAQQLVAELPSGGGLIAIRNASDFSVTTSGADFVSPEGNLVPAPLGFNDLVSDPFQELSGDPDPFLFMLANNPNQVTYGTLGSPVTFPPGSCTVLSAGVEANANDVIWSWGNGGTPVAGPVELMQETCAVPEPSAALLMGLGLLVIRLMKCDI